ncbi:unnamed protein product [Parnassius apollo]|uniref:(apollo) hypothetical protein n=1 Tax=Parnassius apollo TaxID=110799 RepID=A0A8S3WQQ9_PARAO|nr:unnamed protein product [Parnassius apollo]
MSPVTVRDARRDDLLVIHRMIHELATFEGMPDGPQLSVADLEEDGFDSSPPWYFLLIAEHEGEIVGYAMCNRAYSSWTRRAFYLEDLYVVPSLRRAGVGRVLLQELCTRALSCGVQRVDWHVAANNQAARKFYARLGARDLQLSEGRLALRLDAPRIQAVAHGNLLPAGDVLCD